MPIDHAPAHVRVDAAGITLDADIRMRGNTLHVDYRLANAGDIAMLVFDRGDRHAVLTRRQPAGSVGLPFLREDEGGRITLSHVARALPKPAPTVPPTPLARQLDAGATYEDAFTFSTWLADVPLQLRWCVGVAPADPARLFSPETVGDIEIWQADFAFADAQTLLCTSWFDVARGGFTNDA